VPKEQKDQNDVAVGAPKASTGVVSQDTEGDVTGFFFFWGFVFWFLLFGLPVYKTRAGAAPALRNFPRPGVGQQGHLGHDPTQAAMAVAKARQTAEPKASPVTPPQTFIPGGAVRHRGPAAGTNATEAHIASEGAGQGGHPLRQHNPGPEPERPVRDRVRHRPPSRRLSEQRFLRPTQLHRSGAWRQRCGVHQPAYVPTWARADAPTWPPHLLDACSPQKHTNTPRQSMISSRASAGGTRNGEIGRRVALSGQSASPGTGTFEAKAWCQIPQRLTHHRLRRYVGALPRALWTLEPCSLFGGARFGCGAVLPTITLSGVHDFGVGSGGKEP